MGEKLKNVIVFSIDHARSSRGYAVELGWIREVFTLAHVTPVPHAPSAIAGVVNFSGAIVSILDLHGFADTDFLLGAAEPPSGQGVSPRSPEQPKRGTVQGQPCRAQTGDSALLLEVDRCQSALRVSTIDEVSSLAPDIQSGTLLDSRRRKITLIHPPELFRVARQLHLGRDIFGRV